jgi:hypothetical protein
VLSKQLDQWFIPIILATLEAEIRRIIVSGQLRQKSSDLNGKKLGTVAHTCHPSEFEKHKIGDSWSRLAWAKTRSYVQNNQSKKVQAV